jgi:hypothetical protein
LVGSGTGFRTLLDGGLRLRRIGFRGGMFRILTGKPGKSSREKSREKSS